MKIVVLDGNTLNPGDLSWESLEVLGDLKVYERTPKDTVDERISEAEAVFINKTPLTSENIRNAKHLKYIGVLATGYDVVDLEAAKEKGIAVANIPNYGTEAVAQYAIALLLELCHHIGEHSNDVKAGKWARSIDWCFWNHPMVELTGKTIGIIGFGRIGQAVGKIANALGMKILAFDFNRNPDLETDVLKYCELDHLLKHSDVISLHCPLFPSTEGMINKKTIEKMKDGVLIVNNSRGGLIIDQDLADALNSGKIAGAALDVVSKEPITADSPLLSAKNIVITPHISWAARDTRQRLYDIAVDNFKAFLSGDPVNLVS